MDSALCIWNIEVCNFWEICKCCVEFLLIYFLDFFQLFVVVSSFLETSQQEMEIPRIAFGSVLSQISSCKHGCGFFFSSVISVVVFKSFVHDSCAFASTVKLKNNFGETGLVETISCRCFLLVSHRSQNL